MLTHYTWLLGTCMDTKSFFTTSGCCANSPQEPWTANVEHMKVGYFDGYLCTAERTTNVFDKYSEIGADSIAFWSDERQGDFNVNNVQLASLHMSKFNVRSANCPAHMMAYGMLTGQFVVEEADILGSLSLLAQMPTICDPNLMAFSKIVDKAHDMEYAMNVRSSLKPMTLLLDGGSVVTLGQSRLPCYMWTGPRDNSTSAYQAYIQLLTELNCAGPARPQYRLGTFKSTIPELVNETSFTQLLESVLAGPATDAYSQKNKMTVQLLQGLGVLHMSFAFKEAYESYPSHFSSDTICRDYTGPTYGGSFNTQFGMHLPPMVSKICISANKTKDTLFHTYIDAGTTPEYIYNNNMFQAAYLSSDLFYSLGPRYMGAAGVASRHFTAEDCPSEIANSSPHLCPKFEPPPSS